MITSLQAAELDHALSRNGWTSDDVKKLSAGKTLAQVLKVIRDQAEIRVIGKKSSKKMNRVTKRTLQPLTTITIGNKTREELATEVMAEASDYARDLMTKKLFVVTTKPEQVTLVSLTIAELGFTANPRTDEFMTKEFCAKWSAENLEGQVIELCEPEDGPQLRLQYRDQPKGEVLWLAMERIADSGGRPFVFRVERHGDGKFWLFARWADPDGRWNLDCRIVFRLRSL